MQWEQIIPYKGTNYWVQYSKRDPGDGFAPWWGITNLEFMYRVEGKLRKTLKQKAKNMMKMQGVWEEKRLSLADLEVKEVNPAAAKIAEDYVKFCIQRTWSSINKEEEKETTMAYSDLAVTRQYLTDRTHEVVDEKISVLQKKFYISDDDAPRTAKEIVERITAGKYILPDAKVDEEGARHWAYNPYGEIHWRDPAHPADTEGYKTARKALSAACTDTLDIIAASDEATGLKAFQDFKTKDF